MFCLSPGTAKVGGEEAYTAKRTPDEACINVAYTAKRTPEEACINFTAEEA